MKVPNPIACLCRDDRAREQVLFAPSFPEPSEGQRQPILARNVERHLRWLRFPWHFHGSPLVEAASRYQAAPFFPCSSERWLLFDGLDPGVDQGIADLLVL